MERCTHRPLIWHLHLQVLSNGDTSSHPAGKDKADDNKDLDKAELWRPLNCLVDPGSKTKLSRTSAHNPAVKEDKTNESPTRIKAKELLQKSKAQDDNIDDPEPIVLLRKKPGRKRKHPLPSANAASTAASSQNKKAINPVWFSLIASFEQ
jgi:E3 ubiquitin-protein ligase DRIP